MLKNFIRAKVSTHSLLVFLGVLVYAMHRFFADPHAAAWLQSHWVAKDGMETLEACVIAFGFYKSPTGDAAPHDGASPEKVPTP